MKKVETISDQQGKKITRPKDFYKLFNLHYLKFTNKTYYCGKFDLPELRCNTDVFPDYIAGYSHPADYHKTPNTAVAFYQYDDTFDGIHGLYNAIYHEDRKLLNRFKERFKGVKFFISPDYSQFGDIDFIENLHRIKKERIVSLWSVMELGAIAIPNITYPFLSALDFYLDGLEHCHVIAFSTMCYVDNQTEKQNMIEAVKFTVNHLDLKAIVVFDVCGDNKAVDEIFGYAKKKGIKIVVPLNAMKIRNTARKKVV